MFSEPCFHETMVITVPLGHNCFNKVILSMEIGSCLVFSVFLCAVCNATFVSFCFYILPRLTAEPSHIQNKNTHCLIWVLCFFFHTFVNFRVPLATPLGQIVSILGRCWCHCSSNFPKARRNAGKRFPPPLRLRRAQRV